MENIQIKSGQGNYGVDFVSNLSDLIKQIHDISNSVVVIDTKVAELYQELFQSLDRNNTIVKIDETKDDKIRVIDRLGKVWWVNPAAVSASFL